MNRSICIRAAAALVLGLGTAAAQADFSGQSILGPLTNGSSVTGNTTGHSDDNDGFTSGFHPFGIWDGGDDVWRLNWTGGDMTIYLTSFGGSDNDLFLYTPADYNDSSNYSIIGAFDSVTELAAPAGTYYIVVDSTFFSEGAYQLEVVPAPSAVAALGLGGLALGLRRRR